MPTKFGESAKEAFDFNGPIAYYDAFRDFVGLKGDQVLLGLLRRLARKAKDVTVYEWKHEKEPKEIQRPEFGLKEEQVGFSEGVGNELKCRRIYRKISIRRHAHLFFDFEIFWPLYVLLEKSA